MPVIAITNELGTLTKQVVEGLAKRMALDVFYCDLPENGALQSPEAAIRSTQFHHRTDSACDHLLAHGDSQALERAEDVCNFALRGNSITCGSGVTHLLEGVPHIIKVRVGATMALRVRRIMSCLEIEDPEPALERILQADRCQADWLVHLFSVSDRENRAHYDVVLDSGRYSVEQCIESITAILDDYRFEETPDVKATLKSRSFRLRARAAQLGHASTLNRHVRLPARESRIAKLWTQSRAGPDFGVTANQSARVSWLAALQITARTAGVCG